MINSLSELVDYSEIEELKREVKGIEKEDNENNEIWGVFIFDFNEKPNIQ